MMNILKCTAVGLSIRFVSGQYDTDIDGFLANFECLDDPKVIRFANDQEREVHILPEVRMMMCGYSSQCALNMVGYLFMKERLGMNMSLFPTNDYDSVWNGEFWGGWEDPFAYPKFYFEWLYNDSMDMNLEFWPLQLTKTGFDGRADYVLAEADQVGADGELVYPEIAGQNRIDYGGFVGAYGEISVYVPRYWSDDHPTHLVPDIYTNPNLQNEMVDVNGDGSVMTSLWDLLIAASCEGGPAGADWDSSMPTWVDTYVRGNATHPTDKWDRPTCDRPIIWGSVDGYTMSDYAYHLKNNLGLDVDFVTTGSEGTLMGVVADMYRRRVPFLSNIYTIDDNFGSVDVADSELQQFEKMVFSRNPDQSVHDPCYVDYLCQNPVEPIMKAANSRLKTTFPEAHSFFQGFTLSTTQINNIVAFYLDRLAARTTESHTEIWVKAACDWMKSDEPAAVGTWNTSEWIIDTVRYDCLEGCGFEGIGGHCDYYTGHCVCHREELFSDGYCRDSCPGLLGPFEGALLENGTQSHYFEWCSGHGECDTTTRLCSCDLLWGDEGCSTAYSEYLLPVGLQVIVTLLSCILAIVCVLCICWLRYNKQYKTVKALSIDMTTIMSVGLLMIVCSNIALTQKMTSASCIAWQWLFGLGGILAILSPLLKAYRVSRVFHGGKMLRAVKITEKMLMAMLIKCAVFETLVVIGYTVLHELMGGATIFYNDEELRTEAQCNQDQITNYVSMGSYAYFFCMLCALTYYSYGTRRALSVFQESTCAYFSSFLSLFCTVIVFVFYAVTDDPTFRTAIQSFAILIVVTAVLIMFYGVRVYHFYAQPENRDVTDMNASSHSTTHNSAFSPIKANSVMKPADDKE